MSIVVGVGIGDCLILACLFKTVNIIIGNLQVNMIPLLGHCFATWYAISWYLVKLTEFGNQLGAWRYSDLIVVLYHNRYLQGENCEELPLTRVYLDL